MGDHQAKAALYDALAEAAKALANGLRAELVDVLAQGERSVEELAAEIEQTVANTSQHLQRLLKAGLVTSRRDGTRVHYSLASPVVGTLWRAMRDAAELHVAELDRLASDYLGDRSMLNTAAGHIRGAISVPPDDLESRLGEIPDGAHVVAYCRGPYCVYADDAVRLLTRRGVSAARLEDGFPEWAAARLPVGGRSE